MIGKLGLKILLSPENVSEHLNVSEAEVKTLIDAGELNIVQVCAKELVIADSVKSYIRKRGRHHG
jgi:hypothetical protein